MNPSITFLSPAHPLRGGIAASTERLAEEFLDRGWEVKIWSYKYQYPPLLFPGKTQRTDDPAPERLQIEPRLHSVSPPNWWQVGRRLRKEQPDLILSRFWMPFFGPCLGTVQRQARKNGHSRIIGLVDNLIPHEKRPGDGPLTRYYLHSADGFVAMSQSVLDDIHTMAPGKPTAYAPHPIYDNYGPAVTRAEAVGALGLDPDRQYLLFFGFVRAYKGLDLLLHALAEERVSNLPVDLIVAGEFYEDAETYRALIRTLGLESRVRIDDQYIPKERVAHYFAAANLVAQPYKTATQSGITQLAYHFERPMLVTEVGGLPEIVPHGQAGYVVESKPEALAEAIFDFFDRGREAEFTQGVKDKKAEFSWRRLADAVIRVAGMQ